MIAVVLVVLASLVGPVNQVRTANGLPPLDVDAPAASYAQAWSQHMAQTGVLAHSPNLASATTGWKRLGENVGYGPTVGSVVEAFMESPGHRANMLGDWTHVGVGVVEADGLVWVTVVFVLRATSSNPSPTSSPPKALIEVHVTEALFVTVPLLCPSAIACMS